MSISSELLTLQNTKTAIRTAINNKGGSVGASDTFASYATAIDNLPSGGSGNPVLTSIDVSDFTDTTFNAASSYITSITIPNGVTTIKSNAFNGYSNVKSIVLPNSVTTLQDYALSGMKGLETLSFGSGFSQQNGSFAFGYYYSNSTGLRNITVDANNSVYDSRNNCNAVIKTATNELVLGGVNTVIPNTVTKISAQAFYGRSSLTSLNITSNVTEIEQQAFMDCSGLTSISIPDSVTVAGSRIFSGCSSLASATIGSGLTSIPEYMFYNCSGLTSISIPNNITSLNTYAFSGCTSLASVTFGNGLTIIRDQCFSGCRSLTKVVLPDNVTTIGSYVFAGCTSLTSVVFGSGTTLIGGYIFNQVSSLQNVVCKATTPPTLSNNYTFSGNYPIYVPAESVDAYKAATYWSTLASRIYPIQQVATVDGNPVYNYDLGMTGTVVGIPQMAKMPTGNTIEFAEGITSIQQVISGYTTVTLPSTLTGLENMQNIIGSSVTTLIIKADTPPTAQANTPGGAGLTALYVPEASVTDYQADAAWGQFSAITYPLYEVATVDGKSVYNADLGETGQVTTMTSAMLAALPTGTSVKFSDDIDTFSGQIGAYEQVTLPASGMTPLEFTVASPINAATETLTVKFNAISGPDITVANDTLGGAGLTEIFLDSDDCGMSYASALDGLMNTAGFTTFADIIKAKPEDFMVITNLDVEPNPDGVFTMSLAHGEQDTESSDPDALICYAPFTICKPSFATDQATSDGTYLNLRGQQRDYTPQVTDVKLYNGDTLVASDLFTEVDNTGIGADWNSANDVWSMIFYTDQTGDGSDTITLQPGMRIEGFMDGIYYDYDSEASCQQPIIHSYFTINVTA